MYDILLIKDLLFYITEFLDDSTSFKLFRTNKLLNSFLKNNPKRYKVKKVFYTGFSYDNKPVIENYTITNIHVYNLSYIPKKHNHIYSLKTDYNCNDNVDNLPENIRVLFLGQKFQQKIDHLPCNLLKLTIWGYFNNEINYLPKTLQTLIFQNYSFFNQPIDHLPDGLEYLELGHNFNQPINKLPSNLKILKFGYCFNQEVDKLPQSLREIHFGFSFDKNIDELPKNIEVITIHQKYKNIMKGFHKLKTFNCV